MVQLCGMEKLVTFQEAWEHFYNWMQERRRGGEIDRLPADVQEANYAYQGKRRARLGEHRIKALLEKYGNGRYKIVEGVILQVP